MNATTNFSQASNRERLLATVVDACLRDLGRGRQPRVEDYVAQYPQLADDLRALLPSLCTLGEFEEAADEEPPAAPRSLAGDISAHARLGDFIIHSEIGRGGMGVVYKAEQISLHRPVALKVLPFASVLEPADIQRFKNEAQIAAQVHHPHVVPVYAVGCERGLHYYAMQLIEGQTVAQLVQGLIEAKAIRVPFDPASDSNQPAADPRSGKSDTLRQDHAESTTHSSISRADKESFRTIARLGIQAAEALHYAHSLGLVHRDVKPSNLLLDQEGKLWVSDFGLAKISSGPQLTLTGDILGTVAYMSPEQAGARTGVVDHRSDIYSLGATLYELAGLKRVFTSQNRLELLHLVANSEPRPLRQVNRHVPIDLETIVHKALAKQPNERYATARENGSRFTAFSGGPPHSRAAAFPFRSRGQVGAKASHTSVFVGRDFAAHHARLARFGRSHP